MKARVAFLVVLALAACVHRSQPVVQTSAGEVVILRPWTAILSAPAVETSRAAVGRDMNDLGKRLTATATLTPGNSHGETRTTIAIAGGTAVTDYAWYIHAGQCGDDRGILGGLMLYDPIPVDPNGNAAATVTLPFTTPTSGRYFVTVRQMNAPMSAVVACGNLARADSAPQTQRKVARKP